MRPKLHRAAKIRLVLRLIAFSALMIAAFAAGDVLLAMGVNPLLAQLGLAGAAFAVLVAPVVMPLLRPTRVRATMPRALSERA